MSSRDLFEEGDTGEAILRRDPALRAAALASYMDKVNGKGAHVVHNHDLDPMCKETRNQRGWLVGECVASQPRNPLHGMPASRDAGDNVPTSPQWLPEGTDPVWGDVRHHRERIDQLNTWVRYWQGRALTAERNLRIAKGIEP